MKKYKIGIIGSNSFFAKNLMQYIFIKNYFCDLFLYDVKAFQDKIKQEKFHYETIDFESKESLEKINFNCDVLYIFTGKTGTVAGFEQYESFVKINEIYLLNILDMYVKKKSKAKIIYPSTRLVYQENKSEKVKENAPKNFNSIYAITKYAAENYIKLYHRIYNLNFCILRICVPYGTLLDEAGNYGTFEFFINQAKSGQDITVYGDGSIRKTYTHIRDICKIMLLCIEEEKCLNKIFNVGGIEKSLQEIGRKIGEEYNVDLKNILFPPLDELVDGGTVMLNSDEIDEILKIDYEFSFKQVLKSDSDLK